jgi:hypothetical protein
MVISPGGKPFRVDVKGVYKKNFFGVRKQPARDDLYYVFAYVPDAAPNRFFVLTQEQVNAQIDKEVKNTRTRALAQGRSDEKAGLFPGVSSASSSDLGMKMLGTCCPNEMPSTVPSGRGGGRGNQEIGAQVSVLLAG